MTVQSKQEKAKSSTKTVWIVSEDSVLRERIGSLVCSDQTSALEMTRPLEDRILASHLGAGKTPAVVFLDVSQDLDWGMTALQTFKRLHIGAPIVVLTGVMSREFGQKIVSQGVSYYFSYDFPPSEFAEVARNLLGEL